MFYWHEKVTNLEIIDRQCNGCDQAFFLKPNLEKYVKALHVKIKDYHCSQWDLTSSLKAYLDGHVKVVRTFIV